MQRRQVCKFSSPNLPVPATNRKCVSVIREPVAANIVSLTHSCKNNADKKIQVGRCQMRKDRGDALSALTEQSRERERQKRKKDEKQEERTFPLAVFSAWQTRHIRARTLASILD